MQQREYSHSDRVYKALPFVYAAAGLATMLLLRNLIAVISGLTLISAGVVVWTMRYQHRRAIALSLGPPHAHAHSRFPASSHSGFGDDRMLEISWKDSFESGLPKIDSQHRKLFGAYNELVGAVLLPETKSEIDSRLTELIDQISEHFCTEEGAMARLKYAFLEEHRQCHVGLVSKTQSLCEQYRNGKVVVGELLGFIAYELIVNHILKEDLKWEAPRQH